MFKSITGLTITGGIFKKPTTLENILSNRVNLLYGRNGSGKSTIARSLMQAKENPNGPNDYSVAFVGTGPLPSPSEKNIFVFNEDFVDNNFKMKDSLRAIVMLGKNAQLDGPIHDAEKKIQKLEEELKRLKSEAEPYGAGSGDKSISAAEKKIKDDLKVKYLPRITEIGGGVKLTQNLVDAVLNTTFIKPSGFQSVTDFSNDIDARVRKYLSCKTVGRVDWKMPAWELDIDLINGLLSKTVQPAGLTDEDNAMLDYLFGELFSSDNYLESTERVIVKGNSDICPLCHQAISHDHRAMLKARLERFRDKQTEDFKDSISSVLDSILYVEDLMPDFPINDYDADVRSAKDKVDTINNYVGSVKKALENKLNSPFGSTGTLDKAEYESLRSDLTASFQKLKKDVNAFNESVSENDKLLAQIRKDNITQALWEYEADINKYHDNLAARNVLIGTDGNGGKYADTCGELAEERNKLASLRIQAEPIGEAVNIINKYLRLIFGRDRLQLDACGKDKYRILSRGSEVPPKAVSAGERNAIALAYFFACVMEQKEEGYNYSDPTLLVIDDPVSSFDIENRAGITSLLSAQIIKIINGNADSKVLVLTHDLTTLKELISLKQQQFHSNDEKCFLLERQEIRPVKESSIYDTTDYRQRLYNLYRFATKSVDFDNNDTSIGNIARRVLEQYATFRYGFEWNRLFSDERILANLTEDQQNVFLNLDMRPALNSDSHGTELLHDPADMQKIIRMILAYMYLTDRPHVEAHLRKGIDDIKEWANDI